MQSIHPTKIALAILTPLFAAGTAWLAGAAAKYGLDLNATGVTTVAGVAAAGAVSIGVKLIHDVEAKVPMVKQIVTGAEQAFVTPVAAADPGLAGELAGWPSSAPPAPAAPVSVGPVAPPAVTG